MTIHCPRPRSPSKVLTALVAFALTAPLTARAASVWVASSAEKIGPWTEPRPFTPASFSAAKNEFEAVQVAVVGPAYGVSVSATGLEGPGLIPPPKLFREELLWLSNRSGPDGYTGGAPDPLVPDVDDVVGEKRNAFPFDVPAGQTRMVWVEYHVPRNAPPGAYGGNVVVHASDGDTTIPVSSKVWDFALPSTSSLKSHFGLAYGTLVQAHQVQGEALSGLRARYGQLALDHRITLGAMDDGNHDLDHFQRTFGGLIDGYAPTQLQGAQVTSVQFLGGMNQGDHRTWASFFRARGWFDRLFDYTCDEPPLTCDWDDIGWRSNLAKSADPEFRTLVTTDITHADAHGVTWAVDVLAPVLNYMDDKPSLPYAGAQRSKYDGFLSGSRKELWTYQSCMSHGCNTTSDYFGGWASYAVDASAVRNRAMEWLSFLHRATGELYFETTMAFAGDPWSDQWRFGGNGDGTLFYPGNAWRIGGSTDIPVASLRMKMIRAGMQDYEYLKLLVDAGDPGLAFGIASRLFPNAWTQPSVGDLLAAREQIAHRILELTGKLWSPPAPVPTSGPDTGSAGGATAGTTGTATPALPPTATADAGAGIGAGTTGGTTSGASGSGPLPRKHVVLATGCSAGTGAEMFAVLGVFAAIAARRRRR